MSCLIKAYICGITCKVKYAVMALYNGYNLHTLHYNQTVIQYFVSPVSSFEIYVPAGPVYRV